MFVPKTEQNNDFLSWFQQEEQRLGATLHWADVTSLKIEGSAHQHEERIYRPQNRSKLRIAFNFRFSYFETQFSYTNHILNNYDKRHAACDTEITFLQSVQRTLFRKNKLS